MKLTFRYPASRFMYIVHTGDAKRLHKLNCPNNCRSNVYSILLLMPGHERACIVSKNHNLYSLRVHITTYLWSANKVKTDCKYRRSKKNILKQLFMYLSTVNCLKTRNWRMWPEDYSYFNSCLKVVCLFVFHVLLLLCVCST